jgi:hypothetical protein
MIIMALVFGPIKVSACSRSMQRVSESISQNTGSAPTAKIA